MLQRSSFVSDRHNIGILIELVNYRVSLNGEGRDPPAQMVQEYVCSDRHNTGTTLNLLSILRDCH